MYKNNPCSVAHFHYDCQQRAETRRARTHKFLGSSMTHRTDTTKLQHQFSGEGRGGGELTEDWRERKKEARSAASPERTPLGGSVEPVDRNPLWAGGELANTLVQLTVRLIHVVVLDYHVKVVRVLPLQPL
jgi:hypothetical protein